MKLMFLLAWLAGIAGVIQSGLTKRFAEKAGLANALHVSNIIVLVGGLLTFTALLGMGDNAFEKLLKPKTDFKSWWSWWLLVPGAMGLFFVTVTPFAISKIGALHVFVAVVFGQVMGSAVWDWLVEGQPLDRYRVIGAALTLAGAFAISLSEPAA